MGWTRWESDRRHQYRSGREDRYDRCDRLDGDARDTRAPSPSAQALLLRDPQPATAVGTGCLFVDKATGKLSYTDARNEAHALY